MGLQVDLTPAPGGPKGSDSGAYSPRQLLFRSMSHMWLPANAGLTLVEKFDENVAVSHIRHRQWASMCLGVLTLVLFGCAARQHLPQAPDESADIGVQGHWPTPAEREAEAARREDQRARQQRAEQAQKDRLQREKRTRIEQELATGECARLHTQAFQQILVQRIPVAKRAIESDGPVDLGPHKLFVATETPETFEFHARFGGLYNIFVIGVDPVEIVAALDGSGTEATVASPYEIPSLFVSPFLDSRVARAQPLETLSLSVVGRGCALLLVMNQVGQ